MPKIKQEEEEFEEDAEEEFDEDELEQEEVKRKDIRKPQVKIKPKEPVEPVRRYGIIPPQPIRLGDTETNEVIGEGEYLIPMALVDIIERLERIETSIGSMIEG